MGKWFGYYAALNSVLAHHQLCVSATELDFFRALNVAVASN